MDLLDTMIAMAGELMGEGVRVTGETRLGEIMEFCDSYDFLELLNAVEVTERVNIPDEFTERMEWSLARWAEEIGKLPKVDDPLWTFHRIRMISGCWQKILENTVREAGGESSSGPDEADGG